MGLWSFILSKMELAEDWRGSAVHVGDILAPAIEEYDGAGLEYDAWKDYKINPEHRYLVLKLRGLIVCYALLEDMASPNPERQSLPTDLFENIGSLGALNRILATGGRAN